MVIAMHVQGQQSTLAVNSEQIVSREIMETREIDKSGHLQRKLKTQPTQGPRTYSGTKNPNKVMPA